MDEFIQHYEQYSQFIVMALVFLVGAVVYGGYIYYKKQEDIKKVNTNIQQAQQQNIQQAQQQNMQQAQQQQNTQPDFVQSDTFKGEQHGYIFKRGDKGQGYYMDK